MINIDKLTLENKKAWVQGLMVDCPFGKALDTCPAKDLRVLPINERFAIVMQMEENQINEVILHHKRYLEEREHIKPE